ncbi:hypothetical protein R1sor_026864 [Riccia sorocarpa]|uniref:Uncharacterized protein n=1 Tax=Riccia sorocarpa TaxID=122646 RepID=A0ABD3GGA6_9MARC
MVLRYFNEFSGRQITNLINKSNSELKEIFGRFANFLFMKKEQTGVLGWQTAMNYLSALSQVFKRVLFSKQQGISADAEWYNSIRSTLAKKYVSLARASSEPLVESPDPLTDELLLEGLYWFMKGRANLTSHSGWHGATAEADCNQTVNVTWIIERGEWVVDRNNISFEYIFGNSRNDMRVARVLASWPDNSAGGLPPLLHDLDHPTLPVAFSSLAEDLFSQTLPLSLKDMLLAVQLYRFEDVYQYNPSHILVSTIAEHAAIYGLSVADLISIG